MKHFYNFIGYHNVFRYTYAVIVYKKQLMWLWYNCYNFQSENHKFDEMYIKWNKCKYEKELSLTCSICDNIFFVKSTIIFRFIIA